MSDSSQITRDRPETTEIIDRHLIFHLPDEILEIDLTDMQFETSEHVNRFYDRIEDRIAASDEDLWFFLIDYGGTRIDPDAWFAWSRRGKALNLAHSMGTVRYDPSPETRRQIERDAGTDAFDANLFADRDQALDRLAALPSKRRARIVHTPNYTHDEIMRRITFHPETQIMDVDFSDVVFHHSRDVNDFYDYLDEAVAATGRKWYFLVNYNGCRIMSEAWVQYAARGKTLNEAGSLGSVRYATGSETESDIRLRAESQGFRPNIRNTREEAIARIDEMKADAAGA